MLYYGFKSLGVKEKMGRLGMMAAFLEDQTSVPSTHMGHL